MQLATIANETRETGTSENHRPRKRRWTFDPYALAGWRAWRSFSWARRLAAVGRVVSADCAEYKTRRRRPVVVRRSGGILARSRPSLICGLSAVDWQHMRLVGCRLAAQAPSVRKNAKLGQSILPAVAVKYSPGHFLGFQGATRPGFPRGCYRRS